MLNLRTRRKGKISSIRKLTDFIARRKPVNLPNPSFTQSARFLLYFELYAIRPYAISPTPEIPPVYQKDNFLPNEFRTH